MTRRCAAGAMLLAILALGLPAALAAAPGADGQRPWLGVQLTGARVDDASGGTATVAVEIAGVFKDSPAEKAGLRGGDLLLAVDGQPVTSANEAIARLAGMAPGGWTTLKIRRGKDELSIEARLREWPSDMRGARLVRGWLGVEAIDLPETLRVHFGAPANAGVMISLVEPGSPAEAAGLEVGDVVHEVGGEPIRSVGELRERLGRSGVGNRVELSVARTGAPITLEATLIEAPN